MSKTNFYQVYQLLKRAEINELKDVLRAFGGRARFDELDNDEIGYNAPLASDQYPTIVVNTKYNGPQDYDIKFITLNEDDSLSIYGKQREYPNGMERIFIDDIEPCQIGYIIEAIPEKTDQGKPSLIKTADFTLIDGRRIRVQINDKHISWSWRNASNPLSSYRKGILERDKERPWTILGIDGTPYDVRDAIAQCGFALEL